MKLDEIIGAISQADDARIDTEEADDRELKELRTRYRHLAEEHNALVAKFDEIARLGY